MTVRPLHCSNAPADLLSLFVTSRIGIMKTLGVFVAKGANDALCWKAARELTPRAAHP